MIIDQLPEVSAVQETDEIPVERGTTTYKSTLRKLKDLVASLLTKSDVGLGNVDNVRQYSAQNPPPYPVTSVNGQTGDVAVKAFSNLAYSQAQDISALTSLNGTFTAPDYGFIFGELVKDDNSIESQYELKVGDKIVVRYQTGTTDVFYSSFCIPIAKGDTITVSRCSNIFFSNSLYYPKFVAI